MSPARQQSRETLDLIAEHGFTQCLDWETDQVPLPARTSSGTLLTLPVHNELDDNKLLSDRGQDEASWIAQILEEVRFLKSEHARFGAQMLGFQMTPFVAGQPFRMHAVREIFAGLSADANTWTTTSQEIADAFRAQVAP